MKLSPNFDSSEFQCQCGVCHEVDMAHKLIMLLEQVRLHFDKPVHINSGYRCPTHNKRVGGAKYSKHLLAQAADIVVEGISTSDVYNFIHGLHPDTLGLKAYATFTHVDIRSKKWRG